MQDLKEFEIAGRLAVAVKTILPRVYLRPDISSAVEINEIDAEHVRVEYDDGTVQVLRYIERAPVDTLYVRRNVLNAAQIIRWFKDQGLPTALLPEDMHITIAFSKREVDWAKFEPQQSVMTWYGDDRAMKRLGEDGEALVMTVNNSDLSRRHDEFIRGGASWDWPTYQPHITLSWQAPKDLDLKPYNDIIQLGPEIFEPVTDDWKDTVEERASEDVDYIQDPHTGHLQGSRPHGGSESDNVSTNAADIDKVSTGLSRNSIIAEAGSRAPNSRTVPAVAKEVNARAQGILKDNLGVKEITESHPKTDKYLVATLAGELKEGLKQFGDQRHWYANDIKKTMQIATEYYPELAKDKEAQFIFKVAMAISSQGGRVNSSADMTIKAYDGFKKTGKFPIIGFRASTNFKKMNKVISAFGVAGARKLFDQQFTAKDLAAKTGLNIYRTNVGDRIYGSAILGPKVGQAFYQNLNGNFKPITMDRWFMRQWGRITGTGVGQSDIAPVRERLQKALRAEGKSVPRDDAKLTDVARTIYKDWQKTYSQDHEADKPELAYAAERFVHHKDNGMVEEPGSASHRHWIESVFEQAVKESGTGLDNAAAQAVLWTPEQDMYQKLGAKVPDVGNSYSKAFTLAFAKIKKAVDEVDTYQAYAPWMDDADPPDYLTDEDLDRMIEGLRQLLQDVAERAVDWDESKHPRGQPGNAGQFGPGGGGGGGGSETQPEETEAGPRVGHAWKDVSDEVAPSLFRHDISLGSSYATVYEHPDAILLDQLGTPKESRGQGTAGKLVEYVKAYGEQQHKIVFLVSQPKDKETDQKKLTAFYEKHGFTKAKGEKTEAPVMYYNPPSAPDQFTGKYSQYDSEFWNRLFHVPSAGGGATDAESDSGASKGSLSEEDRAAIEGKWIGDDSASASFQKLRSDAKMEAVIAKLPQQKGVVYRGTHVHAKNTKHGQDIAKLKVGSTFTVKKLSSSTTDLRTALNFAATINARTAQRQKGVTPVLFKVEQSTGRLIPRADSAEKEVVLMPKTSLKVTEIREVYDEGNDMTYREISMIEIEQ